MSDDAFAALRSAFAAWLKEQAADVLRLAGRILGARAAADLDALLEMIQAYYAALAGHVPQDVKRAVAEVSEIAFNRVRERLPDAPAPSREWMRGYFERYYADMGERLCKANAAEIERIATRADGGDVLQALSDRLASWGTKRAEAMARTEAAMAVNSAMIPGFKHAGYASVWKASSAECPACQSLNGQTITTLRPPLHKGCMCTVDVGEKLAAPLPPDGQSAILEALTKDGGAVVHTIGKIDREIYRSVEKSIEGDDIVITDERIEHIRFRHPQDWERYGGYLRSVVEDPDIVLRDSRPATAIALKRILVGELEKFMRATIRFHVPGDDDKKMNSIITYQKINKKEFGRLSRNKNVLYRKA